MSAESDRELGVLKHVVHEGEKHRGRISFEAFDDVMNSEWTRRKAEG